MLLTLLLLSIHSFIYPFNRSLVSVFLKGLWIVQADWDATSGHSESITPPIKPHTRNYYPGHIYCLSVYLPHLLTFRLTNLLVNLFKHILLILCKLFILLLCLFYYLHTIYFLTSVSYKELWLQIFPRDRYSLSDPD